MKKKILLFTLLSLSITLFAENSNNNSNGTNKTTIVPKRGEQKRVEVKVTDLTIDIDEAVAIALENNLNLKSSKVEIDYKKWSRFMVWNKFLPSASASASFGRSNSWESPVTTSGTSLIADPTSANALNPGTFDRVMYQPYSISTDVPEWGLGLGVSLSWNLNAALIFGAIATMQDYQSGKLSFEDTKNTLMLNVRKSFYYFLLLQKRIEIKDEQLANAAKRYEQAEINFRNGRISEYDMLGTRVYYENLKPELISIKNNYNTSLLQFQQLIGIEDNVRLNFVGTLSLEGKDLYSFDYNELASKYVDNRLDIQVQKYNIKLLETSKNATIAQMTPSFFLQYSYSPTFQEDIFNSSTWNDKKTSDLWKDRGSFGFGFSLALDPLFPFSTTQMNIIKAQNDIKRSDIGLQQLRLNAKLEIQKFVMNIETSKQTLSSLKGNIDLAQKAYIMSEQAFRAGTKDRLSVENSQLDLDTARLNLLIEEYNYLTNILDLENAINSSLENEVVTP